MIRRCALIRNQSGAAIVEFALLAPLALLFLLGIIDAGRFAWNINQMEKAAQHGARFAVATAVIPGGLITQNYVGTTCGGVNLAAGDTICKEALGTISCTNTSCTCTTNPCPGTLTPFGTTAFNNIAARMRSFAPGVAATNIKVKYSGSGLGYAGDPADGPDIAPIVTIEITGATFSSISLLGKRMTLPNIRYSQTLEDGVGAAAN